MAVGGEPVAVEELVERVGALSRQVAGRITLVVLGQLQGRIVPRGVVAVGELLLDGAAQRAGEAAVQGGSGRCAR